MLNAVLTPETLLLLVWPLPRSLATTSGISFDFSSSPYLDVSVQAVPFLHLFYSMQDDWILSSRVAPFGNLRVTGYLLLTVAYRSLSRPSSAPDAKAFPLRSYQLDLSIFTIAWFSRIMQASDSVHCSLCYPFKVPQKNFVTSLLLARNFLLAILFSFQGALRSLSRPD